MINWIRKVFTNKTPKDRYTEALAKYIKLYGLPTGTKTNQWLEVEAQKQLGPRTNLYKYYDSKTEAIEAAYHLITNKRV